MRPRDRTGSGVVAALAVLLAFAAPAEAHRLKLFATVEDGEIGGYAFFVGGGRPEGVDFVVRDTSGREVFRGRTDDAGNFRWRPPVAADYRVTVDAGDGHWVEGTISADRLTSAVSSDVPSVSAPPPAPAGSTAAVAAATPACSAPFDPAVLSRIVATEVDRSVGRQLRPLLEAWDQAEGRVRFNDVMGGVGMIVGLAGAWLWAASRRRRDP